MRYYSILAISAVVVLTIPGSYAQITTSDQTQERFRQMQTTMDQMPQATTHDQRRNLMGEHIKLMQEQMNGMRSMMGGMMDKARAMDGKMGSSSMMGERMGPSTSTTARSASIDPSIASQMQVMEQRMDIMQRMMEQMLQQMAQEQRQLWANG